MNAPPAGRIPVFGNDMTIASKATLQSTFADRSVRSTCEQGRCSLSAMLQRHGPALLRYLRGRVGDLHLAEDCLQDTLLKAHRRIRSYDPARPMLPWLYGIARNVAADCRQRRPFSSSQSLPESADPSPSPAEAAEQHDQAKALWALARTVLPEPQFSALWLRYVEKMSGEELASALKVTPVHGRMLVHRGRRRLGEALAERGDQL